jgi:uncharacterized membrane protein YbhN (UPF0104 family)
MMGVGTLLVAAMAVYVSSNRDEVAYLRRLSAGALAATLLFQFLSQLFFNEAMRLPLRAAVKTLGFWEFFMVRTGGFFVGSIVPVAGNIGVRLAYLRRRGLTYADFTWATILSNVLALVASAVLTVLAAALLWGIAGRPPALILALSGGVLAVSAAALFLFRVLPRLAQHPRLGRWPWLSGISTLTASRRTMRGVFLMSLFRHTCNFLTFGILYRSLSGASGDFLAGGLVYALTSPVRMVNITPGNLGVNEWVVAIVGRMLASDVTSSLIVALLFRAIVVVAQLLGVLVGAAWIARRGHA